MSSLLGQLTPLISSTPSTVRIGGRDVDFNSMVLVIIGLFFVFAPLDVGQLVFASVGAICYAAVHVSRKVTKPVFKSSELARRKQQKAFEQQPRWTSKAPPPRSKTNDRSATREEHPSGRRECRQESLCPVSAPSFEAESFDAQVQELLTLISPSQEGSRLVQDIASAVKKGLESLIPEAEVLGFASADILRGTAFAVAIPEVDIVLNAHPSVFVHRLQNHPSKPLPHAAKLDAKKLQKSMLRMCTDTLTQAPGFKFRRSAFKGYEPKVTLMAEMGGKQVAIDFSVNTVTPLYNAALLTECGQIEPKAKELILLVRRWAKYRGISHAAKGHLSPYSWSLLTTYFLQVWSGEDQPLLPNITAFKTSSSLLRKQHKERAEAAFVNGNQSAATCSTATLFKEFVHFYCQTFNWRNEGISVRTGKRAPPAHTLPLQIVSMEDGSTAVAPSVEDPFEPRRNHSDAMTGVSLCRLREELARANTLIAKDAQLQELIEPWVPPDVDAAPEAGQDEE